MQRPTSMLENWRNSDPVFFTQVGRMGQRPIVATKGGFTQSADRARLTEETQTAKLRLVRP